MHVLGGRAGAIRSLRFSHDGNFLVAAEPIDYVHLYDAQQYDSCQVINLFGAVAGFAFTPEDQALFIANATNDVGHGIYEFQKINEEPIMYF
ncbi:hypothetical protein EC973_001969 [Apophysomyces ossiformis]|uniref:DUF2415 domain-containing protein n=1 Tax=Apophysomyces ossiformis TaxID=679940 RepID=A0A8H7C067_9FUNG|nr:hypothetical protein EC973_001969 [Apophysomyces ossiformis]